MAITYTAIACHRLLCEGYTAGSHHNQHGSGSNYLCLPEVPQWNVHVNGNQRYTGTIVGAAYGFSSRNNIFDESNVDTDLGGNPAPCAVCYARDRSTTLMIPARPQCPPGWTIEYGGYLASEWSSSDRKRSSFVCWDEAPEIAAGGRAQHQAAVYPVEVLCGTLPCSTYITGRELT